MLAWIRYGWRRLVFGISAALRRRGKGARWVMLELDGSPAMLPTPRPFWKRLIGSPPALSLQELLERLRAIGADPRTKGVVLMVHRFHLSHAHIESLHWALGDVRAKGKQIVVWSRSYSTSTYYLASWADRILLAPGGVVEPLGFAAAPVFLGDALRRGGVELEVVRTSAYKTAADTLSQGDMSEQQREMLEWLFDGLYDEIVDAVSAGRSLSRDDAEALIDGSPFSDDEAIEGRAVDAVVGEEDIPGWLGKTLGDGSPERLWTWREARGRLPRRGPDRPGKYVALVSLTGTIIDGRSSKLPADLPFPLVFGERAGDRTVVATLRKVRSDKRAAAVVVYVDSGGGSAAASDAMADALRALAKDKTVICVMGRVAASGGYAVASMAQHVLAQPSTLTGSIGVLLARMVDAGFLSRLPARIAPLRRGARADLFRTPLRWDDAQRAVVEQLIDRIYDGFVERVSEGRGLTVKRVRAIGGGRVWTGRQAKQHRLIDGFGGLEQGLAKARELAQLAPDAPWRQVEPPKHALPPTAPKDAAAYALEGIHGLVGAGRVLALCPYSAETAE